MEKVAFGKKITKLNACITKANIFENINVNSHNGKL